ncbi:hypothetical protein FPQ18DRAFT_58514 [Pyronema domesticum]|nr:hypothetical protein FPQ18DRAFT_58514 [Pyronema domesticum]
MSPPIPHLAQFNTLLQALSVVVGALHATGIQVSCRNPPDKLVCRTHTLKSALSPYGTLAADLFPLSSSNPPPNYPPHTLPRPEHLPTTIHQYLLAVVQPLNREKREKKTHSPERTHNRHTHSIHLFTPAADPARQPTPAHAHHLLDKTPSIITIKTLKLLCTLPIS